VSPPQDDPGDNLPSEHHPLAPDRSASRQAFAYRLLGIGCALLGVLLVVGGLVALRGKPTSTATGAAATSASATVTSEPPASLTPAASPSPTSTAPASTVPPTTVPASTAAPPTSRLPSPPKAAPSTGSPKPTRAPLTVLNNTTRAHLAEQAAEQFRQGGWQVVQVGNYTGEIPMTTVYYTPGSATEERAAEALAAQFTGISRVLSRYDGLPASVHGVIVVLAPDWP
jgi:LytR cell envelope-related transcriptional attenuator